MKYIKFISAVLTTLLLFTGSVSAASTVVSEGVAAITSNIHVKEYRKRAIENALQNIAFEREHALTSFTIIENGQLLLDQVRSTSRAGILSYKVLNEERKNKTYYVKIEAVVRDSNDGINNQIQTDFCRKTNISKVDLDIALYLDPQQFPHWMNLDIAWLKSEIKKASLKPSIIFVSERKATTTGETNLYTLFDGNETNINNQNLVNIGTAGGMTRLSTGYTFLNIQEQSKYLANNIEKFRSNKAFKIGTKYEFLDKIFLRVLKKSPKIMPNVFYKMFNSKSEAIINFLSNKIILADRFFCIIESSICVPTDLGSNATLTPVPNNPPEDTPTHADKNKPNKKNNNSLIFIF